MEVTGRMNILLAIFLLWFYGFAVSQHLDCPSEDWVVGSSITLECYVPKVVFPSKCVAHPDTATIHVTSSTPTSTRCTFSNISTNTCSGSPNECSCETGNATYYILQYTFTAGIDDSGSWKCEAECFDNNGLVSQLQLTSNNCDNRDVEPTTTPPPTTPVQPMTNLSTPALSTSETSTVQPVNLSTPALSTSKTSTASSTVTGTTHTMASSTTAVSTNSDGSTTGNTQSTEKTTETPQRLITIYVGVGFAGLVLIVLIAIVIVLWYRRHRRQRANRKIQTENISPSSKGKPSPNDTVHHQQETHM